jgi:hypothetical protein
MNVPEQEGSTEKQKRRGFWRSTFDWRMSAAELTEQVAGYSTLGIWKSYRKLSAMLWLLSIAITALIGPWLMKMDWIEVSSGAVIYCILAVFCVRGHRWALILSMVLWTVEKGYSIIQPFGSSDTSAAGGRLITSIIWWGLYMGVFWKALTVERMRRRGQPSMVPMG